MRKVLIIFILLFAVNAHAQEFVPAIEDKENIIVNEELRKLRNRTNILESNTIDLSSDTTGILPLDQGGTGQDLSVATQGTVYYSNGSNGFTQLAAGTSGQVLQTQGAAANPVWGSVSSNTDVAFSVYIAGGHTYSTTLTQINFDTENFDLGSDYDYTTNYRFTAPETGYYLFTYSAYIYTGGGSGAAFVETHLYKNGSVVAPIAGNVFSDNDAQGEQQYWAIGGSVLLSLAQDDYVEVWGKKGGSGGAEVQGGSTRNHFAGFKLN